MNRLKEFRLAAGIAQRGLNARSGVATVTICAVEKYDYLPSPDTRERLAAALGCIVSDIWPETGQREADREQFAATAA